MQKSQEGVHLVGILQQVSLAVPVLVPPVQLSPVSSLLADRTEMEPGLGERWRREERFIDGTGFRAARLARSVVRVKRLRVHLLNPAEAAEFLLQPVPRAVVIAVFGD